MQEKFMEFFAELELKLVPHYPTTDLLLHISITRGIHQSHERHFIEVK
jgi:hypothetical protein